MMLTSCISLSEIKWRSRDIVLVLSADIYDGAGLSAWLQDHFTLNSAFRAAADGGIQQHYTTIFGALNFDFSSATFKSIGIRAEGSYGNLPNLDLINTITRVSQHAFADSRHVDLHLSESIFPQRLSIPALGIDLGRPFEIIPNFEENEQLFTFMANLASGVPNGDHAYMTRYAINAVTLYGSSVSSGPSTSTVTLVEMGRTVEGTLRSLHNLIEPLHQSFYFYLLPSPMTYVSIGHYMITLGLLVAGFTLHPALVLLLVDFSDAIYAFVHIGLAFGAGIVVFALPLFAPSAVEFFGVAYEVQSFGLHNNLSALLWLVLVILADLAVRAVIFPIFLESIRVPNRTEDRVCSQRDALGAASVIPIFVSLPIIALFNFSFAVAAAIPSIFLATILVRAASPKLIGRLLQALLLLASSPPSILYLVGLNLQLSLLETIELVMTNYVRHNSLLYPFISLVWLPFVIVGMKRLLSI